MSSIYPHRIRQLEAYQGRFDARRLCAEGVDVLFASYAPQQVIPPHSHDTDNCGVVLSGSLLLKTAHRETLIGAGEWYEIQAGMEHQASFAESTQIIEFWFKTDVNKCERKS